MNDITEHLFQYRESARHLWNTVFRNLDSGDKSFEIVDDALFLTLVLSQAQPYIKDEEQNSEFFESISVFPEIAPKGSQVMYAFRNGNSWTWELITLYSDQVSMKFMYFFDWKEWGYREFQYARARVLECSEHPELVGADVLIEAQFCNYVRV